MENKTKLATFALAYGICIAICYLRSYWGAFGINVFEYASISDLATRAIFPVAALLVPAAVGSGIAEISPLNKSFPSGGGRDSPVGQFLNRHVRLLFLVSVVAGTVVIEASTNPARWFMAIPFFLPVAFFLETQPFMADLIPSGAYRLALIGLGISALFFATGGGELSADTILKGVSERVVDTTSVEVSLKATDDHPVEYIGYVGGTYFLYETLTKSIVILKLAEDKTLDMKLKPRIAAAAQSNAHVQAVGSSRG